MAVEDALAGGVGSVGNHGEPAASDGTRNDGIFCSVADPFHLGGEIGNRGVVVECGENGRAKHQGVVGQSEDDRFDPPCLATTMDDEGGEEESDEHGAAHGDAVLVVAGGYHKGHEEQEAADEEDRVVGGVDGPREKEDMDENDPSGDWIFPIVPSDGVGNPVFHAVGGIFHTEEFLTEEGEIERVAGEDGEDGFPSKVEEHELHAPAPIACHHEDGGRGKVSEGAADRDVHKEEAESCVCKGGLGFEVIEFFSEEEGSDGHRGRFGDEGSEDWGDGQDAEPPSCWTAMADCGGTCHDQLRESDDRAACRDGHDDDHEGRFNKFTVVADVVDEIAPRVKSDRGGSEGDDPNAEDCFDLSEKVQGRGFERSIIFGVFVRFSASGASFLSDACPMLFFGFVAGLIDRASGECVADREEEDDRRDDVEWIGGDAGFDRGEEVDLSVLGALGGEFVSGDREVGVLRLPVAFRWVGRMFISGGGLKEGAESQEEEEGQGKGAGRGHRWARRL